MRRRNPGIEKRTHICQLKLHCGTLTRLRDRSINNLMHASGQSSCGMDPEEIVGLFRDIRPYVNLCRFPDCTHTHEDECVVKDAVADGKLDVRRYESYVQMVLGDG